MANTNREPHALLAVSEPINPHSYPSDAAEDDGVHQL